MELRDRLDVDERSYIDRSQCMSCEGPDVSKRAIGCRSRVPRSDVSLRGDNLDGRPLR